MRLRSCLLTLPSFSWCDEGGSRGPGGLLSPRVAPLRVKRRLSGDGRPANGASCWTGRPGSAAPRLRVRAQRGLAHIMSTAYDTIHAAVTNERNGYGDAIHTLVPHTPSEVRTLLDLDG